MLLATVSFLFAAIIIPLNAKIHIPACPDLGSLPNDINNLNTEQLSNLKCFCSGGDEENLGMNVNCIFGSKLEDLMEALNAIDDVNGTVFRISLDHIEIIEGEDGITLEEALSSESLMDLKEFEIKECRGGILIEHRENQIGEFPQFPKLESIIIENCDLERIPNLFLSKTSMLRYLSLMGNKINEIKRDDLAAVSNTLEHLDLTSNLITKTEDQSLSKLRALKTLLIGEHNFADDTFLRQIGSLPALEKLNMTRMDGVDDLSKIDFIAGGGGKSLRQWILTGCNLKVLNETDFYGLEKLEELDLRVNLLETIEAGAYVPLKSLQKLSLAGNFLNETSLGIQIWKGLQSLDSLDLGWNELFVLPADAFKGLETLTSLSLRHNEKLLKIETGAFNDLQKVQFLNLSGTALTKIEQTTMKELLSLQEIHLSNCNISDIEEGAFDLQKSTLQKLSLNGNQLHSINVKVLKELYSIQEIDLSNNPWLCDQNIKTLIDWIRNTYKSAAESSRPFFLMGSSETKCSRPYTKEGLSILEFTEEDLKIVYNETLDTTTTTTVAPTKATTVNNDFENITAINFEELFHVVGVNGNDTLDAIEDSEKPAYDINKVKYGQKTTSKNPTNSLFATIAGSTLVVITVISILLMVRHRRSTIRLNDSETADRRISTTKRIAPEKFTPLNNNGVTTAV